MRPWPTHAPRDGQHGAVLGAVVVAALLALTACGVDEPTGGEVDTTEPPEAQESAGVDSGTEAQEGAEAAETTPESASESAPEGAGLEEGPTEDPPEGSAEDADDEATEDPASSQEQTEEEPALGAYDRERISRISDDFRATMEQTTWEPGCPVAIDDLRKLTLRYVNFDDVEHEGQMIVHVDVAEDVLDVFGQLYEDRFPIERIEPIEHFDGDDDASMAANNSSAFNCRPITGSDSWSEHSYGWAVDINPIQNPYERDGEVLPPEGEPYLDRSDVRPGMVTRPGAVDLFDQVGWGWGGDWDSLVDYMHFSLTGR